MAVILERPDFTAPSRWNSIYRYVPLPISSPSHCCTTAAKLNAAVGSSAIGPGHFLGVEVGFVRAVAKGVQGRRK